MEYKAFFYSTNERGQSPRVPVEQRDAVWSKSYVAMAHEAEKFYESLRYQTLCGIRGASQLCSTLSDETEIAVPRGSRTS